jgi:hypothetical protein
LLVNKLERISFERGVTPAEAVDLMIAVAKLPAKAGGPEPVWNFPHIKTGRITSEEPGKDGIASDMAAIRQLYANAVTAAEAAWEAAATEGTPDVPAALHAVEGLADAVTQNRTALVALTAMRNYDNYTFTHMVNVSILSMGQARALGIEGRLLREFGLSALMHDIGKVRNAKGNPAEARTPDRRRVRHHAPASGRGCRDSSPNAGNANPRASRRVRASPSAGWDGLSCRREARHAQPRHDDLQHRGRLRRDAIAAGLSTSVPNRSRARRPQER